MDELLDTKTKLWGSLLLFTEVFYKLRTGREFELTYPDGRESHILSICRELVNVLRGNSTRLIINVPPRYGKTEMVIHFVSWALSRFADSNFIYVSYSHSLAKKQTQTIRQIIQLPHYRKLFGVEISGDTSAKDNFETTGGGSVYAVGAGGTITGRGAGIKGCDRFGGAIIIDDIHKPSEVNSDTIRQGINDWYYNTLQSRINSTQTPIIFIGQRLDEDDLAANLIKTGDWKTLIIPALDEAGNALHPEMHTRHELLKMQATSPYTFSAQYQQDPLPAGGGIFKPEWFYLTDEEPEILATFINADTAETDKDYNDATVFSFWGVYKIKHGERETGEFGLHWIDCLQIRVEPKDLENEFVAFYVQALQHRVKPKFCTIEKKSTGVTLISTLKNLRGLHVKEIERTRASGSKTARFLEIQPYVAGKFVSLPRDGKHTQMCIEHCKKITANNSHRHDDIADTLYDAVKVALIDKIITTSIAQNTVADDIIKNLASSFSRTQQLRKQAFT